MLQLINGWLLPWRRRRDNTHSCWEGKHLVGLCGVVQGQKNFLCSKKIIFLCELRELNELWKKCIGNLIEEDNQSQTRMWHKANRGNDNWHSGNRLGVDRKKTLISLYNVFSTYESLHFWIGLCDSLFRCEAKRRVMAKERRPQLFIPQPLKRPATTRKPKLQPIWFFSKDVGFLIYRENRVKSVSKLPENMWRVLLP